jgi:predicted nucleotidyltransferase
MNEISKHRIEFTKENLKKFKNVNTVAAIIVGSVAKGYADDNSDIDTIVYYNKPFTKKEYNKIVDEAKQSGGDLFHGTHKKGFAVYYYIDGIKCDFGFGDYRENEKLIKDMLKKPEADLMKHLQISGFIDSIVLYGEKWVNKWKKKTENIPEDLLYFMVRNNLKFEPEWVMHKMAVERGDILYLHEYFILAIDRIIWILCGLNKTYHPGKLKGADYKIQQFEIKPNDFLKRCKKVFESKGRKSLEELYSLTWETVDLIDKHMPRQSTARIRRVLDMKLRK